MKLALIGIGQAGGKIVDTFLAHQQHAAGADLLEHALVINTAESDQSGLRHVREANRLLIGEAEVGGHGVGGDNELAAKIARGELGEIHAAFDQVAVHRIDAFLLIAALGGGTGSGAAPVVAGHLQEMFEEPVYGLGILPGADEGGIYALNAARTLPTLVERVDNLLLFDNETWRSVGESVDAGYDAMNQELVTQVELIFRAGEIEHGQQVAESVVDTAEIINTLGVGGISTVGYAEDADVQTASAGSQGLLSRFRSDPGPVEDSATSVNRITGLVRRAARGRLTIEAEIDSAQNGLIVVAGPPELLNRKGIERARAWLEEETGSMQIRGGDYPWSENRVAVSVLLSGLGDIPRIDALQHSAVEAQENQETIREEQAEAMEQLSSDEIDSLF